MGVGRAILSFNFQFFNGGSGCHILPRNLASSKRGVMVVDHARFKAGWLNVTWSLVCCLSFLKL